MSGEGQKVQSSVVATTLVLRLRQVVHGDDHFHGWLEGEDGFPLELGVDGIFTCGCLELLRVEVLATHFILCGEVDGFAIQGRS